MGIFGKCPDRWSAYAQAAKDADFYGDDEVRRPYRCKDANENYKREYEAQRRRAKRN